MAKPWWQSRVLWIQIISLVIAAAMYLGGAGVFEGLGLSAATADRARNWVMLAIAIGNIITFQLRLGGATPIAGTKAAREQTERLDEP
jgi:predicted small integral membrane protein